jgi:hypothetical protein
MIWQIWVHLQVVRTFSPRWHDHTDRQNTHFHRSRPQTPVNINDQNKEHLIKQYKKFEIYLLLFLSNSWGNMFSLCLWVFRNICNEMRHVLKFYWIIGFEIVQEFYQCSILFRRWKKIFFVYLPIIWWYFIQVILNFSSCRDILRYKK